MRAGQSDVDKRIVQEKIDEMKQGDFSWGNVKKLLIMRDASGYILVDGHHKFVAPNWLKKRIPDSAFEETGDKRPLTFNSVPWEEVTWENFRNYTGPYDVRSEEL